MTSTLFNGAFLKIATVGCPYSINRHRRNCFTSIDPL